jgi:hypothetical protein
MRHCTCVRVTLAYRSSAHVVTLDTEPADVWQTQPGCIAPCHVFVRKAVRAVLVCRQYGDTVRIEIDQRIYWNMRCVVCYMSQEGPRCHVRIPFRLES